MSPDIGIEIFCVANFRASSLAPSASLPTINASGLTKIHLPAGCSVHVCQINLQIFCLSPNFFPLHGLDRQPKMRAHSGTKDLWSEGISRFRRQETACTPAAAAVRSNVPRLPGSRIWSGMRMKFGELGIGSWGLLRTARIPCGVSVSLEGFHQRFGNFFHLDSA